MTTLRTVAAAALCVVGATGLALPAQADGMPRGRSAAAAYMPVFQAYDWSGFYLGGQVGAAHVAPEWTFALPVERVEQSAAAFAGGAFAGLQRQWGNLVLGAEVSYLWVDGEQSSGSVLTPGTTLTSDISNLILVTGKVGYAQDRMHAYAKGGYASADIDFRSSVTATGVVTASSGAREGGWTAGLGLEYALTDQLIVGVEYDYIHFNTDARTQGALSFTDGEFDIQTVVARLSYKFGHRAEVVPFK